MDKSMVSSKSARPKKETPGMPTPGAPVPVPVRKQSPPPKKNDQSRISDDELKSPVKKSPTRPSNVSSSKGNSPPKSSRNAPVVAPVPAGSKRDSN